MAERKIVGVDFSGAQSDNKTWITVGFLDTEGSFDSEKGSLLLLSCKSVPRADLTEQLKELPSDAVAALDFPFSVPIAFSTFLGRPDSEMPDMWQAATAMGWEKFIAQRDKFVKSENGELLRAGDLHVPGCYSCLHNANPNMVPMTFHGMKMLNTLWEHTNCQVPPLKIPDRKGTVLLEVMPGAALKAFRLPDKGYKGGQKAFEKRRKILKELPKNSNVNVVNLRDFSDEAMFSDDALDSMVAAVAAAKWAMDESAFKRPADTITVEESCLDTQRLQRISPGIKGMKQLDAAKREGWIYVPKILNE